MVCKFKKKNVVFHMHCLDFGGPPNSEKSDFQVANLSNGSLKTFLVLYCKPTKPKPFTANKLIQSHSSLNTLDLSLVFPPADLQRLAIAPPTQLKAISLYLAPVCS